MSKLDEAIMHVLAEGGGDCYKCDLIRYTESAGCVACQLANIKQALTANQEGKEKPMKWNELNVYDDDPPEEQPTDDKNGDFLRNHMKVILSASHTDDGQEQDKPTTKPSKVEPQEDKKLQFSNLEAAYEQLDGVGLLTMRYEPDTTLADALDIEHVIFEAIDNHDMTDPYKTPRIIMDAIEAAYFGDAAIERVAKWLYHYDHVKCGFEWDTARDSVKDTYRNHAKAIIAAIRGE